MFVANGRDLIEADPPARAAPVAGTAFESCGKPAIGYASGPMRRIDRAAILGETRAKEDSINRLVIVARLQPGRHDDTEALLRQGPPFDPDELGLHRHAAYLTASEVVFLFEAPEIEWIVNDIIDDPVLSAAFGPWHTIVEEPPRLAHERYYWSRGERKSTVGLGL